MAIKFSRPRRPAAALQAGAWADSTLAEQRWSAARVAGRRWALWGAVLGLLLALIAFAPAAWLARALANATDGRVLLADARGTVWSGDAVVVLTGGPDSRDASSLPGRLRWSLGVRGLGFELRASHACCLNGTVALQIKPGFGRLQAALVSPPEWVGQWPAALLGGLGTPWNTLNLGGAVRLVTPGVTIESVQGRWRLGGQVSLELTDVSSRASTLDNLGSYRLTVSGDPDNAGTSVLSLSTTAGPLQLTGNGTWGPGGVRFRGEAFTNEADEAALGNLLNIIGRRNGARSVISIG